MQQHSLSSMGSSPSILIDPPIQDRISKTKTDLDIENTRLRSILHERVTEVRQLTQQCEQYKHDAARWEFAKQKYHLRLGHATARDFQSSLDHTMIAHKEALDKIKKLEGK